MVCRLLDARVFAVSDAVSTAIAQAGGLGHKPKVLPLGPNRARFRVPTEREREHARANLGIPSGRSKVLAWVGRYQDVKRPSLFMDAVDQLGGLGVMIVPRQAMSRREIQLREQIRRRAVGSDVVVKEGGDAREAYWASDILVSTSEFESLGLAILEAMCCGLPVVTTARGGPEGFVEPAGILLSPDSSVPQIVAAIRRLFADVPRRRGELAANMVSGRSMRAAAQEILSC